MNRIACLLLTIVMSVSALTNWEDNFDYFTYLDANDLYKLYWTDLDDNLIEFGMEVTGTGWIALGISPNGQMPQSDIMFAWVDDNDNTVYLQDRHTIGRTYPLLDDEGQDLTLIEGQQVDGVTRIRFTRPKFSCNDQDISLSQGTTRIIYAWNPNNDPTNEHFDDNSIIWHGKYCGSHSLNINTGIPDKIELEDDVEYFDLLMNNLALPASDTTYYCKLFELPIFNDTHHIVKISPILTAGNEGIVHHIVTYICPSDLSINNINHEQICDEWDTNMPSKTCIGGSAIGGWAIGGNDFYFPIEAGLPMSGDSQLHYMIMEIHYDNPEIKTGIIDSSGIRIWHTSQLREYDAGLIIFGSIYSNGALGQFIPPGMNNIVNNAFCTSDCTSVAFNEPIYAFASILHGHLITDALNFRIIRNNKELEPIDSNWNYDFNYQQAIQLDPIYEILPGDEFIMDCYYDSSLRNDITYAGCSSKDEMCLIFLYVYPMPDIVSCVTQHTYKGLTNWLQDGRDMGYLQFNGSVYDLDLINFNNDDIIWHSEINGADEFYKELYGNEDYSDRVMVCAKQDLDLWVPLDNSIKQIPKEFEKYDANIFECDDDDTSTTTTVAPETTHDNSCIKKLCITQIIFTFAIASFIII